MTDTDPQYMAGKTVVITGGARGMGRVMAMALADKGARVLILDWEGEWGRRTRDAIRLQHGVEAAEFRFCDLASLDQVRTTALDLLVDFPQIDVLIANAGITYPQRQFSEEGHEMHFAVCYLAHFLLSLSLLPALQASGEGRLLLIASDGHKACKGVNFEDLTNAELWRGQPVNHSAAFLAYAHAKLCKVMLAKALARRLHNAPVVVNAVSPGYFVNTGIHREMRGIFKWGAALVFGLGSLIGLNTPERGARTGIWLASDAQPQESGAYFGNGKKIDPSPLAEDEAVQEQLWAESLSLCGLSDPFRA